MPRPFITRMELLLKRGRAERGRNCRLLLCAVVALILAAIIMCHMAFFTEYGQPESPELAFKNDLDQEKLASVEHYVDEEERTEHAGPEQDDDQIVDGQKVDELSRTSNTLQKEDEGSNMEDIAPREQSVGLSQKSSDAVQTEDEASILEDVLPRGERISDAELFEAQEELWQKREAELRRRNETMQQNEEDEVAVENLPDAKSTFDDNDMWSPQKLAQATRDDLRKLKERKKMKKKAIIISEDQHDGDSLGVTSSENEENQVSENEEQEKEEEEKKEEGEEVDDEEKEENQVRENEEKQEKEHESGNSGDEASEVEAEVLGGGGGSGDEDEGTDTSAQDLHSADTSAQDVHSADTSAHDIHSADTSADDMESADSAFNASANKPTVGGKKKSKSKSRAAPAGDEESSATTPDTHSEQLEKSDVSKVSSDVDTLAELAKVKELLKSVKDKIHKGKNKHLKNNLSSFPNAQEPSEGEHSSNANRTVTGDMSGKASKVAADVKADVETEAGEVAAEVVAHLESGKENVVAEVAGEVAEVKSKEDEVLAEAESEDGVESGVDEQGVGEKGHGDEVEESGGDEATEDEEVEVEVEDEEGGEVEEEQEDAAVAIADSAQLEGESVQDDRAQQQDEDEEEDEDDEGSEQGGGSAVVKAGSQARRSTVPAHCMAALQPTSSLANFTLAAIKKAKLVMEPFPHVIIPRIFTSEFYTRCLQAGMPRRTDTERVYAAWTPASAHHTVTLHSSAKKKASQQQQQPAGLTATTHSGRQEEVDPNAIDKVFWAGVGSLLSSRPLVQAWINKFKPTLTLRGLEKWKSKAKPGTFSGFWSSVTLVRDQKGFSESPSSASRDKWVVTEYSLAHQQDQQLGRMLLRSKSGRQEKAFKRGSFDDADLEVVSKIPFLPNSVLAYAPCSNSWTSVSPIRHRVLRNSILGIVHHTPIGYKQQCPVSSKLAIPTSIEAEEPKDTNNNDGGEVVVEKSRLGS